MDVETLEALKTVMEALFYIVQDGQPMVCLPIPGEEALGFCRSLPDPTMEQCVRFSM